jgi:threonine dehydratase
MAKVDPTKNYGGKVELVGATFEDALAAALKHAGGDRTPPSSTPTRTNA